jgi:hypothetical protein
MMEKRDLPMPIGAGPRLGAQRTKRGRQVECTFGAGETIRRMRAATLFRCRHAHSPST